MPSVCIQELKHRFRIIRISLLILLLPICLIMLFCAMYSTYLAVNTWDCSPNQVLKSSNDSDSGPNEVKCYTILDAISGQLSRYVSQRKIVLIIRTLSLLNTLSTYVSAWIATYRMAALPLAWLSMMSMASVFITINFAIAFGPMSGINNFELIPIFVGIDLNPYLVTSVVLALDLTISLMAIILLMNSHKKRSFQ